MQWLSSIYTIPGDELDSKCDYQELVPLAVYPSYDPDWHELANGSSELHCVMPGR